MIESSGKWDSRDTMRSMESMREQHISIFGAQGHFGGRLLSRLGEIKPQGVYIEPVVEREKNREAAFNSNLVILTVRPSQVLETLNGIKTPLNTDAQILSFAAGVPLSQISKAAHRPSARMMSDPWFNVSAYVLGERFSKDKNEFIFNYLTRMKPIELTNDESIDRFTLLISQLFVAHILGRTGVIASAEQHAQFIAAQLKCKPELLMDLKTEDDPQKALEVIETSDRVSVSEKFRDALIKMPKVSPADLFVAVSEEFKHSE